MRRQFRQWLDNYRRQNKIMIGKGAKLHNQGHFQQTTLHISGVDSCITVATHATIRDMDILIEGKQNEIKISEACELDGDFMSKANDMW